MRQDTLMKARMVLATIRAAGGHMPFGQLVEYLQRDPSLRTRHDRPVDRRQVNRWLSVLEEEGLVERVYLLDASGRPCIVHAKKEEGS